MDRRNLLLAAAASPLAALAAGSADADDSLDPTRTVLESALGFGFGGGYAWKGTGVPRDVEHRGKVILRADRDTTYCCGYTFAVFVEAARRLGRLEDVDADALRAAQRVWYGATGDGDETERQCALAVEAAGGSAVKWKEARPGDFAQIWRRTRKPSGHSVVFLAWAYERKERIGITYLSSQKSTDGIGFRTEFFAGSGVQGATVDPKRVYLGTLG
ncbi:MAG: hypothetical protein AAFZ87_02570 [Planctomycetota bacterium]